MSSHPKHPKCPECQRSMYKTMVKGRAVAKTDPWAYCRNDKCKLHGVNQSGELSVDERREGKTEPDAAPPPSETPTQEAPAAKEEQPDEEPKAESKPVEEPKASKKAAKKRSGKKAPKKVAKATSKKASKKASKKVSKKAGGSKKASKKASKAKSKDKAPEPAPEPEAKPEAAPESAAGLPEELTNGYSEDFQKAALRIQGALEDESPFSKNICELALSMATKADGPDAAAKLVSHYQLDTKFDLQAPASA